MAMNIDDAVKRFLAWPLPDSVRPDGTYPAGDYRKKVGHSLVGTNLLTADEARQMFEHCLAPPAPVMEGAQREAVAPPTDASGGVTLRDAAEEALVLLNDLDPKHGITQQLRQALEAADRARKPVDASAQAAMAGDVAAYREVTLEGAQREAVAPPTDASGGVTDERIRAAMYACGGDQGSYWPPETDEDWRKALEAADRARKPVDASAQAKHECVTCGKMRSYLVCMDCLEQDTYKHPSATATVVGEFPLSAQPASSGEPVAWQFENSFRLCPFCGSDHISQSIGSKGDGSDWPYIECEACGAMAEPEVWNKRAAPTDVAAYREVTLEDARKVAQELPIGWTNELSAGCDLLAVLHGIHAVIRTDGQQAQPE